MKIAALHEDALAPTVKHKGDAGMDFYSLFDYIIKPHSSQICRTGISINIPKGYVAIAKPKSKNPWLIGAGVIEYTYQGEILFKIINFTDNDIVIRYGDALGQLIFIRNIEPSVEEVELENLFEVKTARGATGGIVTEMQSIGDEVI